MRLFLVVLAAGLLSVAAGLGAVVVAGWLPSYDDAAGRGLGQAFMVVFVGVYAVVTMTALGLSACHSLRRLAIFAGILALLPAVVVFAAALQALTIRADVYELKKQFFAIVTILLPLLVIVAAQWIVLRSYLRVRMGLPVVMDAKR